MRLFCVILDTKDPWQKAKPRFFCALLLLWGHLAFADLPCFGDTLPESLARVKEAYELARSNFLAHPKEEKAGVEFTKACFEYADLCTNSQQRGTLAQEGIDAGRSASDRDPNNAVAHYYLALNLGKLAESKSLAALGLLKQMEKSLLRARELDPRVDHAGPDRSLGLLYFEAPGWPVSIGNKRKAREHLENAVALDPDFPDNLLSLLEAFVRWNEKQAAISTLDKYEKLAPAARAKLSGREWAQAWHDWDSRARIAREHLHSR